MGVLQAWLLVGVPGLIVVAALFTGRSQWRAVVGYVVLVALVAVFLTIPGGAPWGGLVGLAGVILVGAGRGTAEVEQRPEHQDTRARFTHTG